MLGRNFWETQANEEAKRKLVLRIMETTNEDFVDLSTVPHTNSRYKEYERLRHVAEIETAMEKCCG
jgi:hypothetical protein